MNGTDAVSEDRTFLHGTLRQDPLDNQCREFRPDADFEDVRTRLRRSAEIIAQQLFSVDPKSSSPADQRILSAGLCQQ
jgi:hypothetical protein